MKNQNDMIKEVQALLEKRTNRRSHPTDGNLFPKQNEVMNSPVFWHVNTQTMATV